MVLDGKPTEKSTERRALNILTFERKLFFVTGVIWMQILKGKKGTNVSERACNLFWGSLTGAHWLCRF